MDNDKLMERKDYYKRTLKTKEYLVQIYYDKRRTEELKPNEYTAMLILESEISLVKDFLEDLAYIQ